MSTQPCILPESMNSVPALIGWGKGGNVTSVLRRVAANTVWSRVAREFR